MRSSKYSRQSGAALVIALLVFAIAAALMVGLQRDYQLFLARAGNSFAAEQSWAYLLGAEQLGAKAIAKDTEIDTAANRQWDHLGELWAAEATPFPLDEGGWLLGQLEDLQGRFNLNLLLSTSNSVEEKSGDNRDVPTSRFGGELSAPQQQFVRLLMALDLESFSVDDAIALTERIADYIDADSERRARGAEQGEYRNLPQPYYPANRPLVSVSELRAVQDMPAELYQRLAPLVSVWPTQNAKLNIMTAPATVLRSLNIDGSLQPMDLATVTRWVEQRAQGEIGGLDALLEDIAFAGGETGQLRGLLGESSQWFLLSAKVELLGRESQLMSVLERTGKSAVSRYRTQGEL